MRRADPLLSCLLFAACVDPALGERGQQVERCEQSWNRCERAACPSGEVCSASTPRGLRFLGAPLYPLSEGGIVPLVLGGHQSVRIPLWGPPPPEVLAAPSNARLRVPSSTISLAANPPELQVELIGEDAGDSYLRVVDRSGELLDRFAVPVAALDHLGLEPAGEYSPSTPWAVLRGRSVALVLRLLDDQGRALADQGLRLAGASRPASGLWDVVLTSSSASPGRAQVEVRLSDGTIAATPYVIVDQPDRVEEVPPPFEIWLNARVTRGVQCFLARVGESQVIGARWSITLTSPEVRRERRPRLRPIEGRAPGSEALRCIAVERAVPGPVTVEVSVETLRASFPVP
ncbi:MAG: hypothetical protein IT384_05065 [Deltaproteobacteria bacterium]|nr:hypothetical protein [Deltaproteobacteria bacterium]